MDCRALAGELCRTFETADWNLDLAGDNDTVNQIIVTRSGIHILGKYQDPNQTGSKVMDVLQPFFGGGIGYVAALPEDDTADVVIFVGPKGGRASLPL
jgi:hypothetical protein